MDASLHASLYIHAALVLMSTASYWIRCVIYMVVLVIGLDWSCVVDYASALAATTLGFELVDTAEPSE